MASKTIELTVKETHTLKWTLDIPIGIRCKTSPNFTSPENSTNRFVLYFSKVEVLSYLNHALITLQYNSYTKSELKVQYRVSILDYDETRHHTREFQWHYNKFSNATSCQFDVHNYVHFEKINSLLLDGKLTLYCELDVLEIKDAPPNPLLENYHALLENGELSDVVFVVGGKKEFKLHKAILAAQSPVFAAEFKHDSKEALENRVDVPDVDVEVFEQMMRYVYSGKVLDMDKFAWDLLPVADKYQLDHLKSLCEQSLNSNLTVEFVADTLLLADMHNAKELKSKCIEFFNTNSAKVTATDGYRNLIKTRMELGIELLQALSVKASPLLEPKK